MKVKIIESKSGGYVGCIHLTKNRVAASQGETIIDLLENLIDAVKTFDEYDRQNHGKDNT